VQLVAVERASDAAQHGARDGLARPLVDPTLADRSVPVTDEVAVAWTRRLLDDEGIFAGVSSGANASVAVQVAGELDGGNVVFVVGDDGWKHFASGLYTQPLELVAAHTMAWW
jgi:cysteine synthase B